MASRRVEIDDEAKIEARNAYRWYLERNPVVAEAFEQEFQDAIELLKSQAHTFPTYEGETRRYLLPTYPVVATWLRHEDLA